MPIPEIYEHLFQRPARIEAMWPFPVSQAPDGLIEAIENYGRLPSPLQEWVNRWSEEDREVLFDGESGRFHDLYDDLCATGFRNGIHGWLAVIATPVLDADGHGGGCYSWGHYHTDFIFAGTADAILEKAEEWADARYEAATKKVQEGKANG